MFKIREIFCADEKSAVCNSVLRSLPTWFGVESSIVDYAKTVRNMQFYAVFCDVPVGFAALKMHNVYTAEISVMGIFQKHHRKGFGRLLVDCCERYCRENKMEYLTVKTLDGVTSRLKLSKNTPVL